MSNPLMKSKRNNHRLYGGVKGRRPDLKNLRREEAVERTEGWQSLSIQDQLAALNRRLGVGVGAKKQRARLLKLSLAAQASSATA